MKKVIIVMVCVLICVGIVCFANVQNDGKGEQFFRFHIKANSNNLEDQNIKLEIRDAFIEYLTPYIANCSNKLEVYNVAIKSLQSLKNIADNILKNNNLNYESNIKICNQFFPTRYYGETIVESGYYDALICELGDAQGDNWWCVLYPPLCFTDSKTTNSVVYKSKIVEIIEKFKNGEKS